MARRPNSARVLVMLQPKLRKQVDTLAAKHETSVSEIGRKAIKRYVEEALCTTPTQ